MLFYFSVTVEQVVHSYVAVYGVWNNNVHGACVWVYIVQVDCT